MTQYNSANVKLSNPQLDKLKSATKNETRITVKNVTEADASKFAKKTDLGSQRSVFNELDVNKTKTVPVDLTKLSNVVKSDVVKKIVYDEFVKIVIDLMLLMLLIQ